MFPPATNNDFPNLVGIVTAIVIPTLGILVSLFSQRKSIGAFLRFLLKLFSRLAQDTSERPDTLSSNGNGITQQATLLAFGESSKRVDSVEDDVDMLRKEVSSGFKQVDEALQEFGEKWRARMDGDLLINSRKHEAASKRIDDVVIDIRDIDNRVKDLEDWRGGQ